MPKKDPLARKRQYVYSLTHSTRYFEDEDFLKPVTAEQTDSAEKDSEN
jgi:hypothetical protein